jgi:hypothetical protein
MLGRAVFATTVALSFGFGAHEAFASVQRADTSRRPYCDDQADCQATCDGMYPGQGKVGYCNGSHLCYCL